MDKKFIESKKEYVVQGSKYADITMNKKAVHYLYWALGKLQELDLNNKERVDVEVMVKELIEINDRMNEL